VVATRRLDGCRWSRVRLIRPKRITSERISRPRRDRAIWCWTQRITAHSLFQQSLVRRLLAGGRYPHTPTAPHTLPCDKICAPANYASRSRLRRASVEQCKRRRVAECQPPRLAFIGSDARANNDLLASRTSAYSNLGERLPGPPRRTAYKLRTPAHRTYSEWQPAISADCPFMPCVFNCLRVVASRRYSVLLRFLWSW
jgi:hypothetical protein